MIKLNDIVELDIIKPCYGGLSLARYGEDNFVVFVENAIKGEKVKAQIISLNKTFAKAKVIEIINPSHHRIKPFCPMYNACDNCDMGYIEYDKTLKIKNEILNDIFNNVVEKSQIQPPVGMNIAMNKGEELLNYRHKVQFQIRQTKNSKRILAGYFKKNSHEIINIKFCPSNPSYINDITQFIRDNFKLGCYDEKKHKGLLKNILFRISKDNGDILFTMVLNCDEDEFTKYFENEIFRFSKLIMKNFSQIKGVFVNFNPQKTNKISGDKSLKTLGEDYIIERLGNFQYKIGHKSFFQINPYIAEKLFNAIEENIKKNSYILDAYCGVGAIGIYLSEKAKKIAFLESEKNSIEMLKQNLELNDIKNSEIFFGDAKRVFVDFENQNKVFDYVIIDPPRQGCDKEGLKAILKLTKNIVYVSCNPMTLKRDMEILISHGYKVKSIQGFDMFPYTHHIETLCILSNDSETPKSHD